MEKKNFISVLLTVAVASAAIIGGAYALNYMRETESSTPEQAAKQFFADWIGYEGNPLSDRHYAASGLASQEFVDKVDAIVAGFDKGGFDPILCAQDFPEEIKFTNLALEGDKASVAIEKIYSGNSRMAEVHLVRQASKWLVDDIICEEGQGGEDGLNSGVSPAIQNQVGDYIRENINELSPEKPQLGGKFYITSIRFTGARTCIVDYEDGHIALTAEAAFNVPSAQEVEIESFILKEDDLSFFNQTGNLVKNGNVWSLVYEEPGKPALAAVLEFTDNSRCMDEFDNQACSPAYWQVGDRAQVAGEYASGKVLVSRLSVVGEASRQIIGGGEDTILPVSNFYECVAAGNEKLEPDCVGCSAYCETADGQHFKEESASTGEAFCEDLCGDGICQEMVCQAQGCPCAETADTCSADCTQ